MGTLYFFSPGMRYLWFAKLSDSFESLPWKMLHYWSTWLCICSTQTMANNKLLSSASTIRSLFILIRQPTSYSKRIQWWPWHRLQLFVCFSQMMNAVIEHFFKELNHSKQRKPQCCRQCLVLSLRVVGLKRFLGAKLVGTIYENLPNKLENFNLLGIWKFWKSIFCTNLWRLFVCP